VSNALAPQEEDSKAVTSTNKEEGNKVEGVKSKETLLIETNLRTILVDEVNSVSDIKKTRSLVGANRAVQQDDVPDVRTHVIVGPQFDILLLPNVVREVSQELLPARTALVVVVCTPRVFSIDVKNPACKTRSVGIGSLVDDDGTFRCLIARNSGEGETTNKSEVVMGNKVIVNNVSTCSSCKASNSDQQGSLHGSRQK